MAKKLTGSMTYAFLRAELRFTRSALQADPDAEDLLPMTDGLIAQVDSLREKSDEIHDGDSDAGARFAVANQRLDRTCTKFAHAKLASVDMDRDDPDYRRYIKGSPSEFVKIALPDQLTAVEGWLTVTGDSVLENYRPDLTTWSAKGREAIAAQSASSQKIVDLNQQREAVAASLTSSRDALERALAARAEERKLGRDWSETFFRKV